MILVFNGLCWSDLDRQTRGEQGTQQIDDIAPDNVNGIAREGALGYSHTPEPERFEDVLLLDRLRITVARITEDDPEGFAENPEKCYLFSEQIRPINGEMYNRIMLLL